MQKRDSVTTSPGATTGDLTEPLGHCLGTTVRLPYARVHEWKEGQMEKMIGLRLPGGSEVVLDEFPVPRPGPEEALVEIRASGLCGSDLHAYHRPRASEPDKRAGFVSGHEPCGVVAEVGERVTHVSVGDRVFAYHISGCGYCHQCRLGYMVNCTSPLRSAYGEHRDGGNAPFMTASERTLVLLPEPLTFSDGAMLACTAATAFGACVRANLSARDDVFITGLACGTDDGGHCVGTRSDGFRS